MLIIVRKPSPSSVTGNMYYLVEFAFIFIFVILLKYLPYIAELWRYFYNFHIWHNTGEGGNSVKIRFWNTPNLILLRCPCVVPLYLRFSLCLSTLIYKGGKSKQSIRKRLTVIFFWVDIVSRIFKFGSEMEEKNAAQKW